VPDMTNENALNGARRTAQMTKSKVTGSTDENKEFRTPTRQDALSYLCSLAQSTPPILLGKSSIACLFLTVPLIGKRQALVKEGHVSTSKHSDVLLYSFYVRPSQSTATPFRRENACAGYDENGVKRSEPAQTEMTESLAPLRYTDENKENKGTLTFCSLAQRLKSLPPIGVRL
jgi:hypothetical protein